MPSSPPRESQRCRCDCSTSAVAVQNNSPKRIQQFKTSGEISPTLTMAYPNHPCHPPNHLLSWNRSEAPPKMQSSTLPPTKTTATQGLPRHPGPPQKEPNSKAPPPFRAGSVFQERGQNRGPGGQFDSIAFESLSRPNKPRKRTRPSQRRPKLLRRVSCLAKSFSTVQTWSLVGRVPENGTIGSRGE